MLALRVTYSLGSSPRSAHPFRLYEHFRITKCDFCSMDETGVAAHMPGVWQLPVRRCLHRRGMLQLIPFHVTEIFSRPSHAA